MTMPDSQNDAAPNSGMPDLRPPAVLVIGFAGHRDIEITGETARLIEPIFIDLLHRTTAALRHVHAGHANYFSPEAPVLRMINMAADGADLIGVEAAKACKLEFSCVLPFPFDEYQKDFSPSALATARKAVAAASMQFILPGTRAEGPRVYERANDVILANVDLLVAVWDGERASGRAGTGDVVQSAVASHIPVISIDPKNVGPARLLTAATHEQLERPVATDLPQEMLPENLTPLIERILAPPPGRAARRGPIDLYGEAPWRLKLRVEYPMLLKLFGVSKVRRSATGQRIALVRPDSTQVRANESDEAARRTSILQQKLRRIDDLAIYYARLHRSSAASGYLIIIVVALLSAMIGLIFPKLSNASIAVQMAVNALILMDARIRTKRRWLERWLDYRTIAERLRSLRFLHPLGLVTAVRSPPVQWGRKRSWVDWYIRRIERGLGPPHGMVNDATLAGTAKRLTEFEIPEQLEYHRHAFRQLGKLERRLSAAAHVALITTVTIAASLWLSAYLAGNSRVLSWKPIALVALAVFPAATTAFNGIRADADLVRLVERSALATVALVRLQRAIAAAVPTYDRISVAAAKVASLMAEELSEWRYVLETRRARQSYRKLRRRSHLRR